MLIISYAFFPLIKNFWRRSFDGGWVASKIIGVLILSYVIYIFGLLKLFKFCTFEIWTVLIVLGVASRLIFSFRQKKLQKKRVIEIDSRLIIVELFFLLMIIAMSIIRGYQPEIYGLEKYMDYGFIKSILEGAYFPPKDIWWSGSPINYYYFGHLWIATVIKLTGTDAAFGYNLAISLVFGLSTTLILVFIRTWTKNLWFGFLGVFIHSGIGNLHFITTIFKKGWENYWYPDASRLIPGVITEFPVYSYVVYDLHAHVINIPIAILLIGFLAQIFRNKIFRYQDAILLGFLLGICFISNAWDLPIYLFVSFVTVLFFILKNKQSKKEVLRLVEKIILTIIVSAATILPFMIFFIKVDAPILITDYHSPIYKMLQLWGFWLFVAFSFFVYILFYLKKIKYFDWFILGLFIAAIALLIIPEFFYVKDIYGNDYQRANTVFKLTYQGWNIFSLAAAFAIWRISTLSLKGLKRISKIIWILFIFLLITFCGAYTVRAYMSGYGDFKNFYGLNGEKHLTRIYGVDELEAIGWIRNNTSSEDVVLESSGDSYSDYQRVSVNTGRPTVVGWAVHEWLWRGGFGPVGERQGYVEKIYTTSDSLEFQTLTTKFNVKYIYFGNLEKQKYLQSPGSALKNQSNSVFKNSSVTIYRVKN